MPATDLRSSLPQRIPGLRPRLSASRLTVGAFVLAAIGLLLGGLWIAVTLPVALLILGIAYWIKLRRLWSTVNPRH